MKKIFSLFVLLLMLTLAACGQSEEATNNEEASSLETPEAEETTAEEKTDAEEVATPDPRLQEPTEDTVCEMCNMKVYEKDHELGKFSAQAIKEDGSIAFYDDIGCLLNAELAFNETNDKYVRDFNTLEWVLVDDATIVKTDLKTPMNWGYAFFKNEEDANRFIEENEGYYIQQLDTVKQEAKERREAKLKKQAEQQGNGQGMEMHHGHGH
ncbi:MAG: hypothetical protein GX072_00100 [Lysinibacillus sp.]|nr:hypothetical protein [Lysinibacillus sp.]